MYFALIALFMLVLPLLSIIRESIVIGGIPSAALIVKWFVFWAVGWRLLTAGIKQIFHPRYTMKILFGIESETSLILVRELGYANVAIGFLGIASMVQVHWQLGAAFVGGIFYGLAGVAHSCQKHRNLRESIAMGSDLFIAIVLFCAGIMVLLGK